MKLMKIGKSERETKPTSSCPLFKKKPHIPKSLSIGPFKLGLHAPNTAMNISATGLPNPNPDKWSTRRKPWIGTAARGFL
jgi:hypothetical protein